jgi:spore coat polysaccharide biosynthesis predicted glycosyltransferase SpsG/RimJ/RimL family protein N-acetyltransferase
MSARRVLLHCAAGPHIGLGHLVRCLAVAEAAAAAGWEALLAADVPQGVARRLVDAAPVTLVGTPGTGADLVRLAVQESVALVHIDSYEPLEDLQTLLGARGIALSSLEDGTFGRRRADVGIDPGLGAERRARTPDGTPLLLRGARFTPVRPAVRRATCRTRPPQDGPRTVLVVMGGTDATGALEPVARLVAAAAAAAGGWRVVVIDPRADARDLGRLMGDAPGTSLLSVRPPVDDLPGLATGCDLVVTAAGTSVWELACLRRPMALVRVAENQREGYDAVVGEGAGLGLGGLSDVRRGAEAVVDRLAALMADGAARRRFGDRAAALVDGFGAERVVAAWDLALVGPPLRLRRATPADADLLLEWRNDEHTRRWSRSTQRVPRDAHLRWLDASLTRPDRLLLVAEEHGAPVATVRFDRTGARGRWEISITVSPQGRGGGVGGRVLRRAVEAVGDHVDGVQEVLAFVRPDNLASTRLFARAGFVPRPELDEDEVRAYVLVLEPAVPVPVTAPGAGSLGGVPASDTRGVS